MAHFSFQYAESKLHNGHVEDLRQHLRYEADSAERQYKQVLDGSTVAITTNGDIIRTSSGSELRQSDKGMWLM